MAAPPPFVGREQEIADLVAALATHSIVVLRGPVGSGKTRLADQLLEHDAIRTLFSTVVVARCEPGDRASTVIARAERRARQLPGSLARALEEEPLLVVLDDVHRLQDIDAVHAFGALVPRNAEAPGRAIFISRDDVPLRRGIATHTLDVAGLTEAAARHLWHSLEEIHGPTSQGACDQALVRTRGMPLAMRREYARAAFGDRAWEIASLDDDQRRVLEVLAVLGLPAAPTAMMAIATDIAAPERALADLVARQLCDALSDGRFGMHETVREMILDGIDPQRRAVLEHHSAGLLAGLESKPNDSQSATSSTEAKSSALENGGLGWLAPIDRLGLEIRHLVAAGDVTRARDRLLQCQSDFSVKASGGVELLAMISAIRSASGVDEPELDAVSAQVAARRGQVAEALEIYQRYWQRHRQRNDERSDSDRRNGEGPGRGSGHGDNFDLVESATMSFRSGDVAGARQQLEQLVAPTGHDDPDQRCRAAAQLSKIALISGDAKAAEAIATGAFSRDRGEISEGVRARLHLALAAVEEHNGHTSAARAALSRAASAGHLDPSLSALIEARRSACLAREGRVSEAEAALDEAESSAQEIDAVWVIDEIRRSRSLVALRRGNTLAATRELRALIAERRQRGDEIGALQTESDLARVLVRRGELAQAAELVSACSVSVARRKLRALAAELHLVGALIDVAELRIKSALVELQEILSDESAGAEARSKAALTLRIVRAHEGDSSDDDLAADLDSLADEIELGRAAAAIALARGDSSQAIKEARTVAVRAERAGRTADLAEALALGARLLFARGDRAGAARSAQRAAREAKDCGLTSARAAALLVCATLAREEGDNDTAANHAKTVSELATAAGLPIERLVAAEALDAITGVESSGTADVRNAAAATLSEPALDAAARVLADLGLTAVRPYRVISAGGAESFVADANPDILRLGQRSLAVDAVREVIVRSGEQIADLRRRSLLKRLLFLFASSPGHIFSKEDIVQTVWEVEYHPLRHDAALFTNIMRIRRLLGKDGADLIRVSEEGYRFVPPKDYLYVENAAG